MISETVGNEVQVDYLEEISNYIFTNKYARYNEDSERRETWQETVARLENMHLKRFKSLPKEDLKEIAWAFDMVEEKNVVPSMRALQFGGKAIESHNSRLYNCAVRHVDSLRSFSEIFYLLLCGCGVGFGLSKFFLNRLPNLVTAEDKTGTVITYVVEDTIEGWADSVEALLNCYFRNTPYTGRKIVFDYSRIRKKGALLKTGGGKAPGYKGLKNSHQKIKFHLDHIIEYHKLNRLRTVDAYDILMHCADAVLSGGIRRSATSVIFDKDDEDMINAKTVFKVDKMYSFHPSGEKTIGGKKRKYFEGKVLFEGIKYEVEIEEWELNQLKKDGVINWRPLFPHRARSNNSVLLLRNETTYDEFVKIVERTKIWGEPGFVFGNHPWQLFNPCFEIGFIPVTKDGVCGVQFCNLTSQNGRKITSKEKFLQFVKAATIIGTLQAAYTNFPYLSLAAETLTKEEALLGVSITGIMDNPDILLNPLYQQEAANLAKEINAIWAKKLNINPAARITCVKPEGTSSLFLGTASGIHPHHSRRYLRRVQNNTMDNVYRYFKKINPHMCEPSVWSANQTDDIISFPIISPANAWVKSDLTALEHLEVIKLTQQNWVMTGVNENGKPVEHNVSCTVIVQNDEWDEVVKFLYLNREFFAAVSLLPATGDKDYPQAPMEAILTEEDQVVWSQIVTNFKRVDYKKLKEEEDNTNAVAEVSCGGGACNII
jgi:ribonucleoside-triphosphate reductase (thioredoxin)